MFSEPPRSSSKGPKGRPGTQKTPEGPPRDQSGIQGPQQKAQIKRVEELSEQNLGPQKVSKYINSNYFGHQINNKAVVEEASKETIQMHTRCVFLDG